jgi:hypothetical protein
VAGPQPSRLPRAPPNERTRMPAKSEKQRRWAFAKMGEKWARKHHFDEVKGEPKKTSKKKK